MPETASSRPCSRVNGSRSRRSLLLGPISAELVMASSLPAAAERVLLDADRANVERRRDRAEDRPGGGSVGTIIVRQWEKSGAQDPLEPAILLGAAALGARCTAARQTPSPPRASSADRRGPRELDLASHALRSTIKARGVGFKTRSGSRLSWPTKTGAFGLMRGNRRQSPITDTFPHLAVTDPEFRVYATSGLQSVNVLLGVLHHGKSPQPLDRRFPA